MKNNKKIKWFIEQIPLLKKEKIIDEKTSERLTDYYQKKITKVNILKLLIIGLGITSGLLILGGIILLIIIFNWFVLTKEMKTIIAFLILIVPQVICGYTLFKNKASIIIKEIFSLIYSISFGVSIAFIGQIYQLPSNIELFFIIWSLSTILIIYIFNSLSSVPLYLILIISLASYMQLDDKIGLYFYPLYLLLIPFYLIEYKKNNYIRVKLFDYFLLAGIVIGLGITMEKTVPGLWLVAYANLFVILYLYSITFKTDEDSLFLSPFKIAGVIGISILAYMYTYHWPWEDIGWSYYRSDVKFHDLAAIFDYSVCIIFPLISIFLSYLAIKKNKLKNYIFVLFGILIIILFFIVSLTNSKLYSEYLPVWVMNLFILILCGYSFYVGFKNKSLMTVNSAMFLLFLTIISRFFDSDISSLIRGFSFIITGIIILCINLILVKKLKQD
jgi:uncharacterized membrane protein